MNKKQLIAMWIGIAVFAYINRSWVDATSSTPPTIANLLVVWAIVFVITGGLIVTFADKKDKKPNKNNERYLVYLTLMIVVVNAVLVYYTCQSNQRADKLFIGQNKPLIDVTPISITRGVSKEGTEMATTIFSFVNYSGFVANDIAIDVKYGKNNSWISKWVEADKNKKGKEEAGVVLGKSYPSIPKIFIKKLKPGETKTKDFEWDVAGALDLNKTVCCEAGFDGYPVFVRVTWENEEGHVFDEVHKYKLICTKVKSGHSFTFIPEGVMSGKNMR